MDRREQLFAARALQQIPGGSGFEGGEDVVRVLIDGQHEKLRRPHLRLEAPHALDPVQTREIDVHVLIPNAITVMQPRTLILAAAFAAIASVSQAATPARPRPPLLANGTVAPDFTAQRPDNSEAPAFQRSI